MRRDPRVAIVDDDAELRPVIAGILKTAGFEPLQFASGDDFLQSGGPLSFSLVVTDLQMTGATGLDVLQACRAVDDPAEVLLITGHGSIPAAVEAMRLGATDYVAKPLNPADLIRRVEKAVDSHARRREIDALGEEVARRNGGGPMASGPAMREVLARALEVAVSSAPVLITGETGVGKTVVARQVQRWSRRSQRTFLTVDCAAFPEALLDAQIFGASPAAPRRGLLEQANGGTVLLGEIGSLGLRGQTRLLRTLEEGAVRRLGDDAVAPVDTRVLCTATADLHGSVERGVFREDLLHRLGPALRVPSLRDRPEDIEPLARHFVAEASRRLGKLRSLSDEALDALRDCEFPGNVSELRYVVQRAAERSGDAVLTAADFASQPRNRRSVPSAPRLSRARPIAEEISEARLRDVLRQNGGSRVRAARALGISRASLYRLLSSARSAPDGPSES